MMKSSALHHYKKLEEEKSDIKKSSIEAMDNKSGSIDVMNLKQNVWNMDRGDITKNLWDLSKQEMR